MPVPKKRVSHSRKGMRQAHDFLTSKSAIVCPKCAAPVLRHRACGVCGYYRGREVTKIQTETAAS